MTSAADRAPRWWSSTRASVLAALAAGCGVAPQAPVVMPVPVVVPAGVDSSVAAEADSLADQAFVDLERQDRAAALQQEGRLLIGRSDSAWTAHDAAIRARADVAPGDSARAAAAATAGGRALVELDRVLRDTTLGDDAIRQQTARLLDSAEATLEVARNLNPFDTRTIFWLSRVYELQARRLGREEVHARAVTTLEKLARLTPDQHGVFAMLANNLYHLGEWQRAADHYRRAADVYLASYDLAGDEHPALDSALVFGYVRAQADMHVRMLDATGAAAAFARALGFAATTADSAYVRGELAWMAWDDMNIASVVARDSLAALAQAGALAAARDGFHALRATLSAAGAIDEIDWRLAIVDYNLGAGEAAAERLHALAGRIPQGPAGTPRDSAAQRYLDDYGTLCLNLGRQALLERRDNRTALKYFEQAARIGWDGRAAAHLESALLLQSNVPEALGRARHALTGEATLTTAQRLDLYRLLIGLYRRSGDFDQARHFQEAYRALRGP